MEESQGCPSLEPGLKEVLERLQHLQEGWSRAEEQVWLCSLYCTHVGLQTAQGLQETSHAGQLHAADVQHMCSVPF